MRAKEEKGIRWGRIFLIIGLLILLAAAGLFWWTKHNLFAAKLRSTELSAQEEQALSRKLDRLEQPDSPQPEPMLGADGRPLAPEPYHEEDAARDLLFTERELNALIGRDPEWARHMAVALSPDLVSVTALVPVPPEFPLLGGTTVRLRLGVRAAYQAGAPVLALQGVSLGGVPIPKAWLGDLKYKNLVTEFSGDGSFWDALASGIEDLRVEQGRLRVKLRE